MSITNLYSIYGLSSDTTIQKCFSELPLNIRNAILRRDEIDVLNFGLSSDEYLYLISNPLNE